VAHHRSVLAHERAHLTGRHHLLVAVAQALRATLPFVPLFRRAPSAVRDLVELAADLAAVHACGPAAVRNALLTVTRHGTPATSTSGWTGSASPPARQAACAARSRAG
jgi:beta-lactamase regulating signal transducer with metallopeptidase domain